MGRGSDAADRVVSPPPIRGDAGAAQGVAVGGPRHDGRIGLEASSPAVLLERRGRSWVAVAEAAAPPAPGGDASATADPPTDEP